MVLREEKIMKIGVIFTAFNTEEYIAESLKGLIDARQNKLDGHEFFMVAVSLPFKDFPIENRDNTQEILKNYYNAKLIDELIIEPEFIKETEARTLALKKLIDNNCTFSWQIDSDEFYSIDHISKIIKFLEFNKLCAWFKVSYKNFVFDTNTYLIEPFIPARIHRLKFHDANIKIIADSFYDDNNILYKENDGNVLFWDSGMPNMTIPKNYVWIPHYCWLSNERSKKKIDYQMKRWGRCSYKWENGLIFNREYYKSINQPLPETATLKN